MQSMKKLLSLWLPPAVWAVFIFFFSSLPVVKTTQIYWQDFVLKKTAHMIEYGVFAILIYRALKVSGIKKSNAALFAILAAVIYGATDEYHQSFTPGREPRVRDVVFDTIGAILAIYSVWNLLPQAPKKIKNLAKEWRLI